MSGLVPEGWAVPMLGELYARAEAWRDASVRLGIDPAKADEGLAAERAYLAERFGPDPRKTT